jgi:hypothetical protein
MTRSIASILAIAAPLVVGMAAPAGAWEFRVRFVERIGTADVPLEGDGDEIDASSGDPRRIRVQFGVFDDGGEVAPRGGFAGWNFGAIDVSGVIDNSDERRTPGRLAPFNFAFGPAANGVPILPGGDPFTSLTGIDNTLGTMALPWLCGPDGMPLPPPMPVVRGLNEFVSLYEITINPNPGASDYTVTVEGNLIGVIEWRGVGDPIAPDCGDPDDPNDDTPGSLTYAPFPTLPEFFERRLHVVVPTPGGGVALAAFLGVMARRSRMRPTPGNVT